MTQTFDESIPVRGFIDSEGNARTEVIGSGGNDEVRIQPIDSDRERLARQAEERTESRQAEERTESRQTEERTESRQTEERRSEREESPRQDNEDNVMRTQPIDEDRERLSRQAQERSEEDGTYLNRTAQGDGTYLNQTAKGDGGYLNQTASGDGGYLNQTASGDGGYLNQTASGDGGYQGYAQGSKPEKTPALTGETDWTKFSHEELYKYVHEKNDPGQVGQISAEWKKFGVELAEAAQEITETITATESGWTGGTAEFARDGMRKLVEWVNLTAEYATKISGLTEDQARVMASARDSMPEPTNFSYANATKPFSGDSVADMAASAEDASAAREAAQGAQEQAVAVMQTMEQESMVIDRETPQFTPPFNPVTGQPEVPAPPVDSLRSAGGGGAGPMSLRSAGDDSTSVASASSAGDSTTTASATGSGSGGEAKAFSKGTGDGNASYGPGYGPMGGPGSPNALQRTGKGKNGKGPKGTPGCDDDKKQLKGKLDDKLEDKKLEDKKLDEKKPEEAKPKGGGGGGGGVGSGGGGGGGGGGVSTSGAGGGGSSAPQQTPGGRIAASGVMQGPAAPLLTGGGGGGGGGAGAAGAGAGMPYGGAPMGGAPGAGGQQGGQDEDRKNKYALSEDIFDVPGEDLPPSVIGETAQPKRKSKKGAEE